MKEKPKYNMWQTTGFLFRSTWKYGKAVFPLSLTYVSMHILRRLLELFIAPTIVGQLENRVPLPNLIGTILGFTVSLLVIAWVCSFSKRETYTEESLVNLKIVDAINQKACTISYPETQDPKTIKLLENAISATKSAFDLIWNNVRETVVSLASIVIYCIFLKFFFVLIHFFFIFQIFIFT